MPTIFAATEPVPDKKPRNQMLSGLCIGALSGVITSAVELAADDVGVLRVIGTPFLIGGVFGAVFACGRWAGTGKRSLLKALGFTVSCAAAYIAAFYSAFFSVFIFGGGDAQKDARMIAGSPAGSFFVGGSVGAFIVIAGALFLFSEERKPLRMIFRAVAYSPLGGAFGLAAWGMCSILDAPKPASESSGGAFELTLLWLVWQSGMGALLGNLLAPEHQAAPLALPVARRSPSIGLSVARALLVLICLTGVVYFVVPDIPVEIQAARWQRAYKKHLSEKLSLESATSVQPRPVDQILMVRPFGKYLPSTAKVTLGNAFVDPDTPKASQLRPQWYTIRY